MTNQTMMTRVSAWGSLVRGVRRHLGATPSDQGSPVSPLVPWGRIGRYEAVSRSGKLFLLDPEPPGPTLRATKSA